ncbi:TlpA disulfide reductase family protein [Fulvivirga sp.]|uniref:TlpA family protein disulfide reductase n=1 Tax=Fulvivirga sp. TaxID=1931237 RepID=UPI0032EC4CA8
MKITQILTIVTAVLFSAFSLSAQQPASGQWQGQLEYEEVDVPFTFEIKYNGDKPEVTLINGDERIALKKVKFEGDSIIIPLKPFDAVLKAKYEEHEMTGWWSKGYRKKSVPFKATYGVPRFNPGGQPTIKILEKLSVTLKPENGAEYPGVGIFNLLDNGIVTGTLLTGVGDFRYFEGVVHGDSLKISAFDGTHGFMIIGAKDENGWSGVFYFDSNYKETWTATEDPNAALADQFAKVEEGQRPYFDILTAGDPAVKVSEDDYFDKVLIIQLFGTWCPNSFDQTNYLKEWYKDNHERGIEVLAVSFEVNFSKEYGTCRINDYQQDMEVPYQVVLGGRQNKGDAALAFPFLDKINAFPTLVIIDKNGFARYTCNYFNGPATGELYKQFDASFNKIVDELLEE